VNKSKEELYKEYIDIQAYQFHNNKFDTELLNKKYLETINGLEKIIPSKEYDKPKLVIFTHQFLSYLHAPTKLAVDFINLLSKIYEEVIIIISPPNQVGDYFTFNQIYKHQGIQNISKTHFKDEINKKAKVFFLPFNSDSKKYKKIFNEEIKISEVDTIASIGTAIPYFDIIKSNKKLIIPTVAKNTPTTAKYIINDLGYNPKNIYNKKLKSLDVSGLSDANTFKKLPTNRSASIIIKAKYKIKKHHFNICISGNRLEKDFTKTRNIKLIKKLSQLEDIKVHLIGEVKKNITELPKNIIYHPSQQNLQSYYSNFDLVLNIYREGDATQARMALAQEVILASPPGNDFSTHVPDSLIYKNDKELLEIIDKLTSSENHKQNFSQEILQLKKQQASKLENDILKSIEFFKKNIDTKEFIFNQNG